LGQTCRVALSGGDVIWVREIPSDRWDLAISELTSGNALAVLDGEVQVGLRRATSVSGVRFEVTVFATAEPGSLDGEIAARDVSAGQRMIAAAREADPRLADLFRRHGVARKYVYDYGHGGIVVGDIDETWQVTLR